MKTNILIYILALLLKPGLDNHGETIISSKQLSELKIEFSSEMAVEVTGGAGRDSVTTIGGEVIYRVIKTGKPIKIEALRTVVYYWDDKYQYCEIFRDNELFGTIVKKYYLSDREDVFFDYLKWGEPSKGKYIITPFSEDNERVGLSMEILEITEDYMKINIGAWKNHKCKILSRK